MKYIFITLAIILLIPLALSQDCNTACLDSGYSSGICTDSCSEIQIQGGDDCTLAGQAVLIIGSEAVTTYKDADAFIGEDSDNVKWSWIIKNIRTKARTNILDTTDETAHTGPLLGVKNKFTATATDSIDEKAKGTGESFCFPESVICINFLGLTVSEYGTYNIQKTTVDLSSFNSSWSNKAAILLYSADDSEGFELDTADYDEAVSGANGAKTDKIWIIYNSTGSYAAVYYEDTTNVKKLAGYLNADSTGDDFNIADVDYENTQDTDIQIDFRGDFGTADNLDIVLDILGFEGAAATEGADDITINLKHGADAEFTGLGNTSGTADDGDLVWVSTNIGTKDEDHRTLYGIIIRDPKTHGASDKAVLDIPEDQVKAEVEITRTSSEITKTKETATTVLGEKMPAPVLASEIKFKEDNNLIFVGGPCANPLVEEFNAFPKCSTWPLKPGEGMIKYTNNGLNTALLVAGTTAQDTKMTTEFLESFGNYSELKGIYIKITNKEPEVLDPSSGGIDFSDYPTPFVKEGKFQNMLLVVGDKAKAEDTIGAADIASDLLLVTRESTEATNETETQETGTLIEEIPLGNNLADTNFFSASIGKGGIATLLDHHTSIGEDKFDYHEEIMLYGTGPTLETSLSSSDDTYGTNVYMEATAGSLRYYFVFDDEIDIKTATSGSPLTINILENEISITNAKKATEFESQAANKYFLNTGEKVTVESVEIELVDVDEVGSIKINTNNTDIILADDQSKFISGLNVKNLEAFDETGAYCCCTNLLDF